MMRGERLTKIVQRIAYSRILVPIIIETYPNYLMDIYHEIRQVIPIERPRLLEVPILPLGAYPPKLIRRWNMVAAILPRDHVFDLAEDRRIKKIYYDQPIYAFQYPVVPSEGIFELQRPKLIFTSTFWTKKIIGADIANQKGFTGRGILVSIIDTGVSRYHPQTIRAEFETTIMQYRDENGHGEWVTSCVGGVLAKDILLSAKVDKDVYCEGMAPECGLLAIKALGYYIGTGSTSNIIEGIEISINRGADVINMSLGGPSETDIPEDDPFYPVIKDTSQLGIICCCAAGNEGPGENTICSPGAMPDALTIGAYDPITGEIAEFSSRGKTNWGDIKPDVIAPGVNIDSGIVGILDSAGDKSINRFSPISGTSMATPHVSGLIALMRQAHRDLLGRVLTVYEVKNMMKAWAEDRGITKDNIRGWGPITWQIYEWWLNTQYGITI